MIKGWGGGIRVLLITCLFTIDVLAAECSTLLRTLDQTEQVWPYLANIAISGVFDEPATLRADQYKGAPFQPGGQSRPELRK